MKILLAGLFALSAISLDSCQWLEDALKAPIDRSVRASVAEATMAMDAKVTSALALAEERSRTIEQLQKDIVAANDELKKKIELIEWMNDATRDNYKSASAKVTSDGGGYSVARTNLGPAIVMLKGLTPYLDGFKVRLWVTVLVPIELSGLKGTISWMEKDPEVRKKDDTLWRQKPFSSASTFQSGRYTEVEVVLAPASAAGLKEMFVELKTDQVSIGLPRP